VTWDSAKNKKNVAERQLPLSLGGLVLDDEMRIKRHDKKHSRPYYFSPFSGCGRKEVILWR